MGQRIEVRRAVSIAHPQPFLTCEFEAGIVSFTLCPQGVSPFKVETAAVNGKPVAIGNLIAKSPVPLRLRSGGIAAKEKAALTVEQSRQLLNAVFGTRAYLFCLIALQTGLRCGEICGLMWSGIDFDAQIIHVRHNAIFTSAQTVVSSDLKTAAARRDSQSPRRSWRCLQAKRMALRVLLFSTWTTAARFRKPASLICGIWCAAEQLIIPTI